MSGLRGRPLVPLPGDYRHIASAPSFMLRSMHCFVQMLLLLLMLQLVLLLLLKLNTIHCISMVFTERRVASQSSSTAGETGVLTS